MAKGRMVAVENPLLSYFWLLDEWLEVFSGARHAARPDRPLHVRHALPETPALGDELPWRRAAWA
eukprot:11171-Alexandrium_andersonii.AAC.1